MIFYNTEIKSVRKYQFPKLLRAIGRKVEFDKYNYDKRRKYTLKQLTARVLDICVWSDYQKKTFFIIKRVDAVEEVSNVFVKSNANEQYIEIPEYLIKYLYLINANDK